MQTETLGKLAAPSKPDEARIYGHYRITSYAPHAPGIAEENSLDDARIQDGERSMPTPRSFAKTPSSNG